MASNLDALIASTTINVSGSAITLSSLTENERGILLVALLALHQGRNWAATAGIAISERVGRSTGAIETVTVTPGAG